MSFFTDSVLMTIIMIIGQILWHIKKMKQINALPLITRIGNNRADGQDFNIVYYCDLYCTIRLCTGIFVWFYDDIIL